MRYIAPIIAAITLIGCAPEVPDSGAGVGFDTLSDYQGRRQEQRAEIDPLVPQSALSNETIAAAPLAVPVTPAVRPDQNNPGISDEQDFGAVSSRESIESDAQRRSAQQQAYQVIAPTALPTRSGGNGASLVQFALSTSNLVGQSVHRRAGSGSANRFQRNCAKYASSDMAQQAFLNNGGPQRDRQGIDPDGDGFACFWDPTPFRQAVRN